MMMDKKDFLMTAPQVWESFCQKLQNRKSRHLAQPVSVSVSYVRIEGPVCSLFIVAAYLPHRDRVAPCQDDTITDLV